MEDQCRPIYRCHKIKNFEEKLELFSPKQKHSNLDSALNELGMLSTITNSRLEYLKEQKLEYFNEKMKKKPSKFISSTPLCLVHMNSDFVTQLSLSKDPVYVSECNSSDESYSIKTNFRYKEPKSRRKSYAIAPYSIKRTLRKQLLREAPIECKPIIHAEDRASPPLVTRQDSGNKSNPSSPVKSQNSATSVGCSIFRSRSLDDLEISKLDKLKESTCDLASHGEIDTVSQRISELHVS